MKRLEVLGVCVVVAFLALAIGRCTGGNDEQLRAEIARADSLAFTLATAYKSQRVVTDSVTRNAKRYEARLRSTRQLVASESERTDSAIAAAHRILDDTMATVHDLRYSLVAMTERATALNISVLVYQANVDSLLTLHEAERRAFATERASSLAALDSQQSLTDLWKQKAHCRVLGITCPSRKVVALGTALAVVAYLHRPTP